MEKSIADHERRPWIEGHEVAPRSHGVTGYGDAYLDLDGATVPESQPEPKGDDESKTAPADCHKAIASANE